MPRIFQALEVVTLATLVVGVHAAACGSSPRSHKHVAQISIRQEAVAANAQTFEVASVRRSLPGTPFRSNVPLFGSEDWKSDYLSADAIFMVYMSFAYNITDPVQGRAVWDKLPAWARSDFFHVEARTENVATRDQMRLMMQSLLADRFKLAVHRETVQKDAFVLTLKKPGDLGSQLRVHPADQQCVTDPNRPSVIPAPSNGAEAPHYCGMLSWSRNGQEHIQIVNATMPEIANYLASASMREGVVTPHAGADATGLNGRYDLDLHFAPSDDADNMAGGPTFIGALEKQAGFKLTHRKTPMQLIVIDRIELPTPN